MLGGASLYSLSVAWVSSFEALAPKRVFASQLGLVLCVTKLRSSFCNQLTKGSKNILLFYAPILVFEQGQCYTRRFVLYNMDPVQIIANIPGSESPDLFGFETFECFRMGVQFGSLQGLKTQRSNIIILIKKIIIMMMMNSRDDVGFSSVSWIRQGLLELDRLKDSPFQNLI